MPPIFLKTTATTDERLIDELTGIACDFPLVRGIALSVVMRRHFAARGERHKSTMGSVTGDPLRTFALESVRAWYSRIDRRRLILIGAGGISTGAQAYEFLQNGASLTQLVTALVYRGPSVALRIKSELLSEMKRDGVATIHEVIGCAVA
jgi:dihydroorotate dehydrogenase